MRILSLAGPWSPLSPASLVMRGPMVLKAGERGLKLPSLKQTSIPRMSLKESYWSLLLVSSFVGA